MTRVADSSTQHSRDGYVERNCNCPNGRMPFTKLTDSGVMGEEARPGAPRSPVASPASGTRLLDRRGETALPAQITP